MMKRRSNFGIRFTISGSIVAVQLVANTQEAPNALYTSTFLQRPGLRPHFCDADRAFTHSNNDLHYFLFVYFPTRKQVAGSAPG